MTKEKTKAKIKTNTSGEFYDLQITAPGLITLEGIVKDNSSKTILLNRKRDGSSLRVIQAIPKTEIIFVVGSLGIGDNAKITFMDPRAPMFNRPLKRVVIGLADKDTGMLTGTSEKGERLLINTSFAKLMTAKEAEISDPTGTVKKKKSKK